MTYNNTTREREINVASLEPYTELTDITVSAYTSVGIGEPYALASASTISHKLRKKLTPLLPYLPLIFFSYGSEHLCQFAEFDISRSLLGHT